MDTGASFWIVDNVKQAGHDSDIMTLGNQKCIGAIPDFSRSPIRIRVVVRALCRLEVIPKRSDPDPRACVKKYLMVASFSWLLEDVIIKGINEYRFSSRPIQIVNQLFEDKTIIIPRRRVNEKNSDDGFMLLIIEARKELNLTL